jgi:hypothetical protein
MGYKTLYLGQSTPLVSAARTDLKWKADYIVTGLVTGFPGIDPEEYMVNLWETFKGKKIVVSGILVNVKLPSKMSNITQVKSVDDLKSVFNSD